MIESSLTLGWDLTRSRSETVFTTLPGAKFDANVGDAAGALDSGDASCVGDPDVVGGLTPAEADGVGAGDPHDAATRDQAIKVRKLFRILASAVVGAGS